MTRKGLFHSLVLAGVLTAGFVVVWGVLSIWAMQVCEPFVGKRDGESLFFLRDGRVVVARGGGLFKATDFRDLKGNPVPDLNSGRTGCVGVPTSLLPTTMHGLRRGDASWSNRLLSLTDCRTPATYWYYIADGKPDGPAYLVGYDSQSRTRVGYLGVNGFREERPPPEECFHVPSGDRGSILYYQADVPFNERRVGGRAPRGCVSPWDVFVVGSGGKLYHADLQTRTVRLLLDEPRLLSATFFPESPDRRADTGNHLAVRYVDAVVVLDTGGRELKRYPIPESLRGRDLSWGLTMSGEMLMWWSSPHDPMLPADVEYRICWSSADGSCREATTSLPGGVDVQPPLLYGLLVPAPVVLGGFVACTRSPFLLENGFAASYPQAVARAFRELGSALLTAQLVAAVFAALCYLRQRRYGASRAECVAWPLFVLAFGLPGWLGYRFGRSWPALDRCPGCGARAPQDREACGRCEAEFPRPALVGTEVFA
jgi:hypothetical protein